MVVRRRRNTPGQSLEQMAVQTRDLVGVLLRENRALKAENVRLTRELERALGGWEDIRKLVRTAPRRRRGR